MDEPPNDTVMIIRTERGLTIAGTRTTLYNVMDYLNADWPPHLIQKWLMVSDVQLKAALIYIQSHQDEVEAEYQKVLLQAQAIRAYWEELNHERFARIATLPPKPGAEALYAKLQTRKAELGMK